MEWELEPQLYDYNSSMSFEIAYIIAVLVIFYAHLLQLFH